MTPRAALHFLSEFMPIIGFFIAGQFLDFFAATAVLMILTVVALTIGLVFERRLPVLPLISALFVLVSGGVTLVYTFPDALILADTIYYVMLGGGIALGLWRGVNLLKRIFAASFAITDEGWLILTRRWMTIFFAAAGANEVARFFLTPEEWVDFRFIKIIALAVFAFYQFTLARKYRIPEESNDWGLRIQDSAAASSQSV